MTRDPYWGLEGPKCVKTIRKQHKYHPKVSPNTLGSFFWGVFSPQIARKRLSPQTPPDRLLSISPTASARKTGIQAMNRAQGLKIRIFLAHRLRNHHAQLLGRLKIWLQRPLRGPRSDFWGILAQKRLSPQVPRHTPHCQRARKPVFWP